MPANTDVRRDKDRVAAISDDCHWIPIGPNAPYGAKCLLINKKAGVAMVSRLAYAEKYFDHWFPLPTFKKEANYVRDPSNVGGTDDPPMDRA